MEESSNRMLDKNAQPDQTALADWLGDAAYQRWAEIANYIDAEYPGVFVPEWLYGGKKHGWSLRYKKSKSFCTLIPERGQMIVVIVFGAEERQKAEAILPELSSQVRSEYESATTYHDGKWVKLVVDSDDTVKDLKRLLAVKKKPRRATVPSPWGEG